MKKNVIVFWVMLLASCVLEIDYRLYESQVDLPLMSAQAGVKLNFYVVKKVPLSELVGLEIEDAKFNFIATSDKEMTFKVMVQDTGPDKETTLYATCEPEIVCSGIYTFYKKTPDYIVNSPSLIQGTVDGYKVFKDVEPEEKAIEKIESAFEIGTIWIIVNVSTDDPLYFTEDDSLHIKDLEGVFKIRKEMGAFGGIAGGIF